MKDKALFSVLSLLTHPLTGFVACVVWVVMLFNPICAIVLRMWLWGAQSAGYEFSSVMTLVFACGAMAMSIIIIFVSYIGRCFDRLIVRFLSVRSQRRFGVCDQAMIERAIKKINAAPGRTDRE